MDDQSNTVSADELLQFIEAYEQLQTELDLVSKRMAAVMTAAWARGYNGTAMRKVIELRKSLRESAADEDATFLMYKAALGMP